MVFYMYYRRDSIGFTMEFVDFREQKACLNEVLYLVAKSQRRTLLSQIRMNINQLPFVV